MKNIDIYPSKLYETRFYMGLFFFGLILMALAFGFSSFMMAIICSICLFYCASCFYNKAINDIFNFKLSFEVAITLSLFSAYAYTMFQMFFDFNMFGIVDNLFAEICFVLAFANFIKAKEVRDIEKSFASIDKLSDILPKSGRLQVSKNKEKRIFATEIVKDDILKVYPGEKIPCDGKILEGESLVEDGLITGNVIYSQKTVGSNVYAGTVNKSDTITIVAKSPLKKSKIFEIIKNIKKTKGQKIVYRSFMDNLSGVVFPLIFMTSFIAAGAFMFVGKSWDFALGVFLIIIFLSFPAGMLFASWAVFFYSGQGAKKLKIDIRNKGILQDFDNVDVIFLDKTGTLTYGDLKVSDISPIDAKKKQLLIECAILANNHTKSIFSKAIKEYAQEHNFNVEEEVKSVEIFPGLGVSVMSQDGQIFSGRKSWLEDNKIKIPKIKETNKTKFYVSLAGKYIGYIAFEDRIRPKTKETINYIQKQGMETVILSGDNEHVVNFFANISGIKAYKAGILPQDKAHIIESVRKLGRQTVMIGDGFNDIPALLKADISIGYFSGTNTYIDWTDIVIRRKDLFAIADIIKINKIVSRTIVWNIIIAFIFNIIILGIVAGSISFGTNFILLYILLGVGAIVLNSRRLVNIRV